MKKDLDIEEKVMKEIRNDIKLKRIPSKTNKVKPEMSRQPSAAHPVSSLAVIPRIKNATDIDKTIPGMIKTNHLFFFESTPLNQKLIKPLARKMKNIFKYNCRLSSITTPPFLKNNLL